ncbi:hypothetical protein [Cloacibacillus porcorum]|jgi:hypothetical protein|uniref:Phage tail protein n=1 Tax=Cloacibacillus porcorum TaxID=1197717 RepID=A0A1B2I668_9BACT|nr:hypothetical protein [Cloacibacillus porcorum]ANZ45443.1 hypothetical protein BED41_10420 [Cloacibacillus porcorum]
MSKKLVRYKNVNGVLVKQFESPALVNGLVDIGQLPVVGSMGAAVIERGSNANGSWVKWSDGTMICTGQVLVSFVGSDPYKIVSATFPAVFTVVEARLSSAYISCGSGAVSTAIIGGNPTGTSLMISPARDTIFNTGVSNEPVTYLAVGRWK